MILYKIDNIRDLFGHKVSGSLLSSNTPFPPQHLIHHSRPVFPEKDAPVDIGARACLCAPLSLFYYQHTDSIPDFAGLPQHSKEDRHLPAWVVTSSICREECMSFVK